LNEANATLDQPAGSQQQAASRLGGSVFQAIKLFRGGGFRGQVERPRHRHLHAIGQFVRADPGAQGQVGRILGGGQTIELANQFVLVALLLGQHSTVFRRLLFRPSGARRWHLGLTATAPQRQSLRLSTLARVLDWARTLAIQVTFDPPTDNDSAAAS
jgi:hypothetical protein